MPLQNAELKSQQITSSPAHMGETQMEFQVFSWLSAWACLSGRGHVAIWLMNQQMESTASTDAGPVLPLLGVGNPSTLLLLLPPPPCYAQPSSWSYIPVATVSISPSLLGSLFLPPPLVQGVIAAHARGMGAARTLISGTVDEIRPVCRGL